ncbi:MAG: hypothetical protein AAF226_01550 [Verrucomicrobiota bacterium]
MNKFFFLASLFTLASLGQAQVYTPPTQNSQPANTGAPPSSVTTINNQQQQPQGSGMPMFDPGTETFTFDGKTFAVNDNRLFRSRYEKYLNAAGASSEQDQEYRNAMREILDILSPHNQKKEYIGAPHLKLAGAVAKLQHTAQYPQDGRLCESLANAVYRVFLARESKHNLMTLNKQLDRERRRLDWNFEMEGKKGIDGPRPLKAVDRDEETKEEKRAAAAETAQAGTMQRYIQRIAEVEAERVTNKAKAELTDVEAKLEFQGLLVSLFLQRRYEHVIMGTRLYTEFFKDGSGKLDFEDGSDVQAAFSKSIGFNPTITTLDSTCNELIRDADQSVEAFQFLLNSGELDGANRQLQQAFAVGEYMPSVQSVTREDRRKILTYAQNYFQLVSALEVKDYTLAEELVNEMRTEAKDFDYSKPLAKIETSKVTANMRIRTAKNAALAGNTEAYEQNMAAAVEIWPTNPQLSQEFDKIADMSDSQSQAKIEFDRLLGSKSYRQIFDNSPRFIAATVDDKPRQDSLNQILKNIQEIDTVMVQADSLAKAGSPHAAWEIVEKTFKKFPDDVPLSTKRSDLSTEVSDFVKALKTAEDLEGKDQKGSSLAWFLSARKIYPKSDYAQEGIERLADLILPDGGTEE